MVLNFKILDNFSCCCASTSAIIFLNYLAEYNLTFNSKCICVIRSLVLVLPSFHYVLVFPDATRVVLRARDNSVTFVVKRAGEYFVLMPVESLNFISSVCRPNFASLVRGSCYNFVSLRVELNLGDFVFMALQQRYTGACEHIINASVSVCTGCGQFVASCVKACVQYFVIMASKSFNALPRADIPKFASAIDASR